MALGTIAPNVALLASLSTSRAKGDSSMTVNAYILIQAEVGSAGDVAEAISTLDSVITAEVAMGPYDVITRAKADNMDQLGSVVVNTIGKIPGVERTLLCPIINIASNFDPR